MRYTLPFPSFVIALLLFSSFISFLVFQMQLMHDKWPGLLMTGVWMSRLLLEITLMIDSQ